MYIYNVSFHSPLLKVRTNFTRGPSYIIPPLIYHEFLGWHIEVPRYPELQFPQ